MRSARHAAADPLHLLRVAADLELVARLRPRRRRNRRARHCRLPRYTVSAADGVDCRVERGTSGERTSASSGTFGCSLSVSVIMPASHPPQLISGCPQALHLGRDSFRTTSYRSSGTAAGCTPRSRVVRRLDDELASFGDRPDFALLDDDLAAFEHVPRIREQHAVVHRACRDRS